jgi:DNA-binding response OmpR family regulator
MELSSENSKHSKKVMIIEDEVDILHLYKDFLNSKGFVVIVSSTTADEAIFDYEKYKPDTILLDYKLPGKKNGLQAAKEILLKYPYAKILIATGNQDLSSLLFEDDFFNDKKVGVLIKPFRLNYLIYKMAHLE